MRPIGTRQAARRAAGIQLETREWSSVRVCSCCATTRMRPDAAANQPSVTARLSHNFGECELCRVHAEILTSVPQSLLINIAKGRCKCTYWNNGYSNVHKYCNQVSSLPFISCITNQKITANILFIKKKLYFQLTCLRKHSDVFLKIKITRKNCKFDSLLYLWYTSNWIKKNNRLLSLKKLHHTLM